jgi:polyisoprenoid-binding protein YceI
MLASTRSKVVAVLAVTLIAASAIGYAAWTGMPRATETAGVALPTPVPAFPIASATPVLSRVLFTIEPSESQVQYEVNEVFITDTNRFNVAVGVTQDISGSVLVDFQNLKASRLSTLTINIQKFKSDQPLRDLAIQKLFLESAKYPIATFVPTDLEGLPDTYRLGDAIAFNVTGDLTARNITTPVTFAVKLKNDGRKLTGTATTRLRMTGFGFGPIEIPGPTGIGGLIKTEDEGRITFTFTAYADQRP